ncbi:MAG TPA: DUF559 domain-containing protein, partial [Kofleriaceae bacterium]|nr:DUF559 domain-containing protein [Kofleriaceae bacterium]
SRARQRAARFVATAQELQARSAAELAMLRALEATPATAGRFELNARLSVRFGGTAAEVDLLARAEGVAVEIDGVFHFDDAGDYRRDRRKDLLLQLQGLIVVRVLAEDVMQDPTAAVRAVCEALAVRQLRPGGPGAPGAAHRRKARG